MCTIVHDISIPVHLYTIYQLLYIYTRYFLFLYICTRYIICCTSIHDISIPVHLYTKYLFLYICTRYIYSCTSVHDISIPVHLYTINLFLYICTQYIYSCTSVHNITQYWTKCVFQYYIIYFFCKLNFYNHVIKVWKCCNISICYLSWDRYWSTSGPTA